jgi:hypothetical protein
VNADVVLNALRHCRGTCATEGSTTTGWSTARFNSPDQKVDNDVRTQATVARASAARTSWHSGNATMRAGVDPAVVVLVVVTGETVVLGAGVLATSVLAAGVPDGTVVDAAEPATAVFDATVPAIAVFDAPEPATAVFDATVPATAVFDAPVPATAVLEAGAGLGALPAGDGPTTPVPASGVEQPTARAASRAMATELRRVIRHGTAAVTSRSADPVTLAGSDDAR